MKKILSILLTVAMLFSLAAVMAIPTAAVDGDWHITPGLSDGDDDDDWGNDSYSGPGWEYTDRGFHLIPTTAWENDTPWGSVQTKNKVDLKEGVYLEIEIDNFTYKSDKWFNLNIWDSTGIAPGDGNPKYGEGVQTLMRPSDYSANGTPGPVTGAAWYYKEFTAGGASNFVADQNKTTEAGHPILCMTLTWNGSTYALDINGAAAPAAVINFMNEKWGGNESEAYIGFIGQNSHKGGTVEFTITKFGTNKNSATVPMGDDSEEPVDNYAPPADIADPDTVPENEPAIFLNADKENGDSKNKPGASNGGYSTVNDDFSIHVIAESSGLTAANYSVKKTVSYDIQDFPVAITLTKNFCSCGNEDGSCDAFESATYYIMYGDVLEATPAWHTSVLNMSYNSYSIPAEDGSIDTYLYFFCDFSEEFPEPLEGRINGLRFDVTGIDLNTEGRNVFDVMFTAFFRNTDEAEAFVVQYLKDNYGYAAEETSETEPPAETDTDAPATTETDTETPEITEDKGGEATTEKKTDETDAPTESGCASVVGFSAIASIVAISAGGVVAFRKKRES